MKNEEYNKYLTCIGVKMEEVVYMPKHRTVDGFLHYSAGICVPCLELTRKLRISKNLSANGLEKELLETFEVLQTLTAVKGGKYEASHYQ
jgi:hypothetical protein